MKKMMFTLIALLTMSAAANAMSYEQARNEALFLTDKMAMSSTFLTHSMRQPTRSISTTS